MSITDFLKPLKPILAPFEFVGKKAAILINFLLLTLTYFTAVAATAIIAKTFRKKFLELRPQRERQSYWMERKKEDYSKKEAYRGF
ncbi:hypothetical protein HYU18_05100 [Candidatus Woesearchaeota archaeon]|nr:hypothetical protein [Candidatus Woesearchaeota archaeon]